MPDANEAGSRNPVFDYVIAGAGSAGAVLAGRLSEDPGTTVLLLEAGGPGGGLWETIPLGVGKVLVDPGRIWRLHTEPSGDDNGVPVEWVSGRCVGGSSAVNGMVYVRGHRAMYDRMAAEGCTGWSYADCLPYFRKIEDCAFGEPGERSRGGPIGVQRVDADPISEAFLGGWRELGVPVVDDYNNASGPDGAGYLQLSARNGRRAGTSDGYLRPVRGRPNLTVMTGAVVHKVLFHGQVATGVAFTHRGRPQQVEARRETILSAGAVRTPQLLELSGVGDRTLLERLGIPVVLDCRTVGENLQDHLMARIGFETDLPVTVNYMLFHRMEQVKEVLKYLLFRTGHFATTSLKSTAFVRSRPGLDLPDLRIQLGLLSAHGRIPKGTEGIDPGSAFHVGVYGLYPRSRGSTHIQSGDVAQPPRVMPNYLRDDEDRRTLVAGLTLVRALAATSSMRPVIRREIRPADAATTPEQLLDYAKATGSTCWHPVGTCRMGSDPAAVVDPECRVRGVDKLRVVDASVFPFLTSSNTNVPVIMLAEKTADRIRSGR